MIANHAILRKFRTPKNLSEEGFQLFSCLVQTWWGQWRNQTFFRKKVWTCDWGVGGQRSSSKVVCLQKKSMYFIFMNSFFCFTLIFMLQNIGLGFGMWYWFIRNWISNFKLFVSKCSNYGRGRGVRTKSEHPNFLRPYLPNGGGAAEVWTMSKAW